MTGFGRARLETPSGTVVVELRSLNQRSLEVKLRSGELSAEVESALIAAIRNRLSRGQVSAMVELDPDDAASEGSAVAQDADLAGLRAAYGTLEKARVAFGFAQPIDLSTLVAFASSPSTRSPKAARAGTRSLSIEAITPAVDAALDALVAARETEGAALAVALRSHLQVLKDCLKQARLLHAAQVQKSAERLRKRLQELLAPRETPAVDETRLAQEVALLAARGDATEEMARLDAHLEELGRLLGSEGSDTAVGRKLEFWVQEIGREFNTMAAKALDPALNVISVEARAELEKIREQAQNIE
ncbi:MAG: DUF1732 domain-containing protein [Deltaproteobacteria bacterium]|nr:DUF1732 domain-containing protein [Deltaproteobacteria bacterium]